MNEETRLSTLTFTAWADAFSREEIDRIVAYGDSLMPERLQLVGADRKPQAADRLRITHTAWIEPNADTKWLFDRMQGVAQSLNDQTYQYDLRGFSENFQYTVYHGSEGGHYDWHVDHGPLAVPRKLSMTVQLTDPSEYQGCELQFCAGGDIEIAPRERGTVVAFPSYVLHRVTPVISGTRRSLVVWTTGPKFR
jgi:PKHD-type hydroxylase